MQYSRRNFIKKSTLAAVVAPSITSMLLTSCNTTPKTLSGQGLDKFGLQLWSVKEDMIRDAKGTLKIISECGYKQIESFGGEKGIFWGMKPLDFKNYLSDLGMEMVSSHINPEFTTDLAKEDEFKKLVEDGEAVGIKYFINPFPGELKTPYEWHKVADGLNRQGEITKMAKFKMAYHNHHLEFLKLNNENIPYDILLNNTDEKLVDFELDLYWIVKAGGDPEKYFKEFPNRFKLAHIKDLFNEERVKEIEATEKPEDSFWPLGASTTLGNGRINFAQILKTGKENGMEYFIGEQERFDNSTPLEDIKKDADYLKNFKFS